MAMVSDSTAEPPQRLLLRTSSSLVKDTPFEKKAPQVSPKHNLCKRKTCRNTDLKNENMFWGVFMCI